MLGAELNILNTKGDIDLDEDYWRILDIRIAGIHSLCWQGGSKEENTQGVINAMRNPFVQIISHPGDGTAELDFEELMKVSRETHTLLEINNHSMLPSATRAWLLPIIWNCCNLPRSMKLQSSSEVMPTSLR